MKYVSDGDSTKNMNGEEKMKVVTVYSNSEAIKSRDDIVRGLTREV